VNHPLANAYVCELRTICEVHREMYDIVIEKDCVDEKLVQLLQESFVMAKKMDGKLRQYKFGYDEGWWKLNQAGFKQKLDRRIRRHERGKISS